MSTQLVTMVDWIDSFYMFVSTNVKRLNPSRPFGGIVQARSWPPKELTYECFYLLLGSEVPMDIHSWSNPSYTHRMQWLWRIQGTQTTNSVGLNGGTRYRTQFQMQQELLAGMFPGFCEKQNWMANGAGVIATSYSPKEFVWYGRPQFDDRYSAQDGLLNASATVTLSGFGPSLDQL